MYHKSIHSPKLFACMPMADNILHSNEVDRTHSLCEHFKFNESFHTATSQKSQFLSELALRECYAMNVARN